MKEFKMKEKLIDLSWDKQTKKQMKLKYPKLKKELKLSDGSKIVHINRTAILIFKDGRNEELHYAVIHTEKGKRYLTNKKFRLLNKSCEKNSDRQLNKINKNHC